MKICGVFSSFDLTLQGSGTVESVSSLQRSLGLQETRTRIAFLENEQAELETEIRWVVWALDTQSCKMLRGSFGSFQIAEEQS